MQIIKPKNNYRGIIIGESLGDKTVIGQLKIISTKIKKVTEEHKTPWIPQWTLYTFEISPGKVEGMAELISKSLDKEHNWYVDFNNGEVFYVIFSGKVFSYKKGDNEARKKVVSYGLSLGIPEYQLDFP